MRPEVDLKKIELRKKVKKVKQLSNQRANSSITDIKKVQISSKVKKIKNNANIINNEENLMVNYSTSNHSASKRNIAKEFIPKVTLLVFLLGGILIVLKRYVFK